MQISPPGGHGGTPPPKRTATLELMPNRVVRVGGAVTFPGWAPKQVQVLERTFQSMLSNFDSIFGYSRLNIRLSPEARADKRVISIAEERTAQEEKIRVITVNLNSQTESTPDQLGFFMAMQMASLIAPDRLHALVLHPGGRGAEKSIEPRLHTLVKGFPRYMNHKGVLALLRKKLASNEEVIDSYKLIYRLIEPAPRPVDAIKAASLRTIEIVEHNMLNGIAEATRSPWENLRLLALFSVIADKLEIPEIHGHCQAVLQDQEFVSCLLRLEAADRDIPLVIGKPVKPSEEEAAERFRSLFNVFWVTADEYYDATTLPLLDY